MRGEKEEMFLAENYKKHIFIYYVIEFFVTFAAK